MLALRAQTVGPSWVLQGQACEAEFHVAAASYTTSATTSTTTAVTAVIAVTATIASPSRPPSPATVTSTSSAMLHRHQHRPVETHESGTRNINDVDVDAHGGDARKEIFYCCRKACAVEFSLEDGVRVVCEVGCRLAAVWLPPCCAGPVVPWWWDLECALLWWWVPPRTDRDGSCPSWNEAGLISGPSIMFRLPCDGA